MTTPRTLAASGCTSVFSDGNCAADITVIENDVSLLGTHVDWQVMGQERWNNTVEDPDRMRRRMAEFLVHERVPVEAITQLAVRGAACAQTVRATLRAHGACAAVDVRPAWYY